MKKPKTILMAIALLALVACKNENRTVEVKQLAAVEDPTPPADLQPTFDVDSFLNVPDATYTINAEYDKCAQDSRQILIVKTAIAAQGSNNYLNPKSGANTRYILLQGDPSPSSCEKLKAAYLHFLPDAAVIPPAGFIIRPNGVGELHIYYHENRFEAIFNQVNQPKALYCWRGVFGGGNNIYGDIHTQIK